MKSTKANPKPGVDPKIVMYTRERKYNDLQIIEFTLHTFKSTVNRKKYHSQRNHQLMRHCNKKIADSFAFLKKSL